MGGTDDALVLTTPRRAILLAMAGCAAGLALGLWFIGQSDDPFMRSWSWCGVALLAMGELLLAFQLRRPTRLILTPEGFTLTGLAGTGLIPWAEVERFFVYSEDRDIDGYGGVPPHAVWRLRDGAASAAGLTASINRAGGLSIDGSLPRNIGMKPEALAQLMEDRRRRHTPHGG